MPGRHARHDGSFRRSLASAGGRVVLLGLAVGAVTYGLTQLGRAEAEDPTVPPPPSEVMASPSPADPSGPPTAFGAPRDEEALPPDPGEGEALDGDVASASAAPEEPVSVQVLYEAGSEELADDAAERLEELGYRVEFQEAVSGEVPTTRVLWTEGHETDAEVLGELEPRVEEIDENDRFTAPVALHVLVGEDWEDRSEADEA